MERELTLTSVEHPLFIDGDWIRVDHPTVKPLHDGAADLGWDGDPRLVIYLHQPSQVFVLWRLEADNTYRPVARIPDAITPESMNTLIRRLVEVDQRRGFDPYADVVTKQNRLEAVAEQRRHDRSVDFADKFHFALSRTHLPGIDVAKRVFPLGG